MSGAGAGRAAERRGAAGAAGGAAGGASRLGRLLHAELGWFGLWAGRSPRVELERAALPTELSALVERVSRRSRLWRHERADVVRELASHFREGLERGATASELVGSFGDARAAARLIGRAKRRARGLWWLPILWAQRAVIAFITLAVLTYLWFGVQVWGARPTITRDYLAELNATALAVPESERAWPLIREAMLASGTIPFREGFADSSAIERARPGSEAWPSVVDHVERNQQAVELLRRASERRALAYVSTARPDFELVTALGLGWAQEPIDPEWRGSLFHLWDLRPVALREGARLMGYHAMAAASSGDGAGAVADVVALARLSNFVSEPAGAIDALVSASIINRSARVVRLLIEHWSQAFSDAQLRDMAHALASHHGSQKPLMRFDADRLVLADVFQRLCTDDGRGGGLVLAERAERFFYSPEDLDRRPRVLLSVRVLTWLAEPVRAAFLRDRDAQVHLVSAVFDEAERMASVPMWERRAGPLVLSLDTGALSDERSWPASWVFPAVSRQSLIDLSVMRRDGALVLIALELYRRREGVYPASLEAMVPGLLPSVPVDQFTGRPLMYALRADGTFVLYSAGADRDDDGGRASEPWHQAWGWIDPGELEKPEEQRWILVPEGDAVLWPIEEE